MSAQTQIEARVEHAGTYLRVLPDGAWFRVGDLHAAEDAPEALRDQLVRGFSAPEAVSGDPVRGVAMMVVLPSDVAALVEQAAREVRTCSVVTVLRMALLRFLASEADRPAHPAPHPTTHLH